jgi:SseB protein N-terminal domain
MRVSHREMRPQLLPLTRWHQAPGLPALNPGRRSASSTVWVVFPATGDEPRARQDEDDGSADPRVAAALAAFGSGQDSEHAALAALACSRLLVPIIAAAGRSDRGREQPAHGRAGGGDRDSEMSLPTLVGRDGRSAIPAFTCLDALATWRKEARPVPAPADLVWRTAVDDSCAVVVDIAGPIPIAIDGARLAALAGGRPVPLPHEDPDVLTSVRAAAADQQAITRLRLAPGQDGNDLEILVTLGSDCTQAAAGETIRLLGAEVMAALGGRLRRGIAIAVTPAAGHRES